MFSKPGASIDFAPIDWNLLNNQICFETIQSTWHFCTPLYICVQQIFIFGFCLFSLGPQCSVAQYFSVFFNIFHLVPNVELPTARRGTIWAKVGNHYRRQHGAPADKESESESSFDQNKNWQPPSRIEFFWDINLMKWLVTQTRLSPHPRFLLWPLEQPPRNMGD